MKVLELVNHLYLADRPTDQQSSQIRLKYLDKDFEVKNRFKYLLLLTDFLRQPRTPKEYWKGGEISESKIGCVISLYTWNPKIGHKSAIKLHFYGYRVKMCYLFLNVLLPVILLLATPSGCTRPCWWMHWLLMLLQSQFHFIKLIRTKGTTKMGFHFH